jgi:DNA-binding NtrC family response regulator
MPSGVLPCRLFLSRNPVAIIFVESLKMQADTHRSGVEDAGLTGIIGASAWTRSIRAEILAVAACPSNVLITGPTGTGKELIARAIHAHSPRAGKPFIPVDCAGVAGSLFASHIFGHLRGAFTGAGYTAMGCFRAAHGGTIFLDEIGELEGDVQTKLLRVLQQRTVTPVGSHEEIPVDVRVITATNRDLEREVGEGRFREDLYYRLNVVSLRTTPLRERPEDIADLACHFLNKLAINYGLPAKLLSDAALLQLQRYEWPGNVRQLENVLERAVFLSTSQAIGVEDFFPKEREVLLRAAIAPNSSIHPPVSIASELAKNLAPQNPKDYRLAVVEGHWSTMAEVEREHIRRTLEFTNGNQSTAAQLLGMERHQLARKVHKYGLDVFYPKRLHSSKRAA